MRSCGDFLQTSLFTIWVTFFWILVSFLHSRMSLLNMLVFPDEGIMNDIAHCYSKTKKFRYLKVFSRWYVQIVAYFNSFQLLLSFKLFNFEFLFLVGLLFDYLYRMIILEFFWVKKKRATKSLWNLAHPILLKKKIIEICSSRH